MRFPRKNQARSIAEALAFGYDSFRLPGSAKERVGFVPQQEELVNQLSGADQLRLIGSFYPRWDQALITRLLFSQVETGFLRQGMCSVSVLLLLLAAIGIYREFPIQLLALGIPLLILGTVASTYLGLMMIRGIDWLDCTWAVGTMLIMMFAAIYADGNNTQREAVIALEAGLAILAFVFRAIAARRWGTLDWTMCRNERATRLGRTISASPP